MNQRLYTLDLSHLNTISPPILANAISALESGQVIYLPNYAFTLEKADHELLTETILDTHHKNVSYDYSKQQLGRISQSASLEQSQKITAFMHRFAEYARELVSAIIPRYDDALLWGKTSFRPAEVKNRNLSKRKDDTRLHVDAFASTPVYGRRILRVFCNINPQGAPRVWELGEPFPKVLETFSSKVSTYNALRARILVWLKASKTIRSHYDHFMIKLHDAMKRDDQYQKTVTKQRIDFPAQSSWIVFTDHVSHAALGGQYLLEQTFYLPVTAMERPELSPLKQLEAINR